MNEKYLAGLGAGLIILSFGIIILYPVFLEVEDKVKVDNGAPGFVQLQAIKDGAKEKITNNTVVEEFRELLGNVSEGMREKITTSIEETFPKDSQNKSSETVNNSSKPKKME
jgi:hypothetical protein